MILDIISAIAFGYVSIITARAGLRLAQGYLNPTYMLIGMCYIFCGLPLLMEIFDWGNYVFGRYPRMEEAILNKQTRVYYSGYMIFAFSVLWNFRPGKKDEKMGITPTTAQTMGIDPFIKKGYLRSTVLFICMIFILSPLLFAILSPDRFVYLNYAAATRRLLSLSGMQFHSLVAHGTKLGMLGMIAFLYLQPKLTWGKLLMAMPYFASIWWLHGKRTIIALSIVLLFGLVIAKIKLSRPQIIAFVATCVMIVIGYTNFYQTHIRDYGKTSFSSKIRIDFTRDDVIKMALLSEVTDEFRILEYRGQSLVFHALTYVPREMWPDKPLPYAQYFTSAIFKQKPRFWGWGMTTSIFDEMIANFSWFGIILAPTLLILLCHFGYNPGNPLFNIYTGLMVSLLVVVHMTPVMPMLLAWLAGAIYFKIYKVRAIRGPRLPMHPGMRIPAGMRRPPRGRPYPNSGHRPYGTR